MSGTSAAVGAIIGCCLAAFFIYAIYKSANVVKEKEVIIIERLGRFYTILPPGVHFIIPFVDAARTYNVKYNIVDSNGHEICIEKNNIRTISTQNEVIDFPKQSVITRDNAKIYLDAVLQYSVTSPKTMIYSVQNLPNLLSQLLHAQIRNVAGSLDVDQIIEDTAQMDRVSGLMDAAAVKFGVKISLVKIQRVDAGELSAVLATKKQADLRNKEIIIQAKAHKQTNIMNSEGNRDRIVKEAEGTAQQLLSRARGQAQAILNAAEAEARSITEISKAVIRQGEDPASYLLALRYVDALEKIMKASSKTKVRLIPRDATLLQYLNCLPLKT